MVMTKSPVDITVITKAVELACRAPSLHNSQPWRWVASHTTVDLFADPHRVVRSHDSSGREALISCGAHKALGDNDLAAADAATAQSIYRQLGLTTERVSAQLAQGGLTKREIEILTRIGSGATNKQVAEQSFISERTVRRHLANIYAKLGVSSRTAAVTWAYANNVLRSSD